MSAIPGLSSVCSAPAPCEDEEATLAFLLQTRDTRRSAAETPSTPPRIIPDDFPPPDVGQQLGACAGTADTLIPAR